MVCREAYSNNTWEFGVYNGGLWSTEIADHIGQWRSSSCLPAQRVVDFGVEYVIVHSNSLFNK